MRLQNVYSWGRQRQAYTGLVRRPRHPLYGQKQNRVSSGLLAGIA